MVSSLPNTCASFLQPLRCHLHTASLVGEWKRIPLHWDIFLCLSTVCCSLFSVSILPAHIHPHLPRPLFFPKPSMTLFLCRNLSIDITVDPDVYTMVGTEVFTLVAQDASQPLTSSTSAVFTIRGLWVPSSCRPILLGGCILSSLGPLVSLASLPTVAIGRSDSVD